MLHLEKMYFNTAGILGWVLSNIYNHAHLHINLIDVPPPGTIDFVIVVVVIYKQTLSILYFYTIFSVTWAHIKHLWPKLRLTPKNADMKFTEMKCFDENHVSHL